MNKSKYKTHKHIETKKCIIVIKDKCECDRGFRGVNLR